ncbi:MAG: phosphatase PAP2 family protein [Prevotella sp.]|jgi:membrane-associated phospholipid phosphatase|nr:phosphatase PAP2 family protein [Prevotella sp.]
MEETLKPVSSEKQSNVENTSFIYEPSKEKEALWAQMTSIVLHPLLMGVYGVALLFFYTDFNLIFAGQFIRFISPVFFLTCVVPASGIYFLKKAGLIKDYAVSERYERFLPYLTTAFSYSLLIYYFYSAKLSIWFIAVLAAPLILIIIAAIITYFWKISVHMIGIGGLIGCTLSVCYNVKGLNPYVLFIILFILAGLLGVSRLALKRHTPGQVYAGFLVGLIISYLCVWIGAYWGFMSIMKNL